MTDLSGKHAIVTGGNRGIGAAIASALAGAGATITIMGRDTAKLTDTAATLAAQHGLPITTIVCDVTDEDSVTRAFATARDAHGTPFVLVNNAGQAEGATLTETTRAMWDRLIAVNLTGTFLCSQQVIEGMTIVGAGRIINIASTAGLKGSPRISAYCASKHGVVGFTRALAMEAARTGVTVNAICPSYTATEMTERTVDVVAAGRQTTKIAAREMLEKAIPIGRLITPAEVAAVALYLCSPEASAITGQALAVDGGESQR